MAKRALHAQNLPEGRERPETAPAKKPKLVVLLVTGDDGLWTQLSPNIGKEMVARQLDSAEELIAAMPPGQAAIVLWDARGHRDIPGVLTRLQMHSSRLAVVALDDAAAVPSWASRLQHRQIVAVLALPATQAELSAALASAREEACVRVALLGEGSAATPPGPPETHRKPWMVPALGGASAAAAVGAAALVFLRHTEAPVAPAAAPVQAPSTPMTPPGPVAVGANDAAGSDDKVFALIDKAQQAMAARHFIDPVDGSALSLYREALVLDPANGEARQGTQRIAEILLSRVESALDERKFDAALQSLETARSINPDDARLKALDARIAGVRAELGPAQIQAAITAQNFDRANQLIDEAARAKFLPAAKLNQLRDDVRRHREEIESARLTTLVDTRLQQDRLIDPARDSAAYYLNQARAAGAGALQPQWQEFFRRGSLAAHAAIDQHRFADAERWLAELRADGVPVTTLAGLQHDLAAAHAQPTHEKADSPSFLDLARARLVSGNVVEPETDSALFYVNQLRATDPQNPALAQITSATQGSLLERARAALDAGQLSKADSLLQLAGGLGDSADVAALGTRLQQAKKDSAAAGGPPAVAEASLTRITPLTLDYPRAAQVKGQEGWVELGYTVSPDGKITQLNVTNSSPPGVFDAAAMRAIGRLRYKPPLVNGSPAAVSTGVRLVFRVAK